MCQHTAPYSNPTNPPNNYYTTRRDGTHSHTGTYMYPTPLYVCTYLLIRK